MMKKFSKVLATSLLLLTFIGVSVLGVTPISPSIEASAAVIGDDYPAKWKNPALDSVVDSWGMYNRECTSFVANRLSVINKFNINRGGMNWNANMWGTNARNQGYRVDMNPAVGSVAWWNGKFHVAWVAEVSGDQVKVEEYNYDYTGHYHVRWVPKNSVDGYIHFKDLGNTPTPPNPSNKLKVYKIDEVQKVNGILQVRCNELVPVAFNWTQNGIAAADIDLTDSSGKLLTDQNTVVKGKLFVFNVNRVNSVGSTITADGGYQWSKVNLTTSGTIWLKTTSKNELLTGVK